MFDVFDGAKNAITAFSTSLKITSSNIGNLGTTGFKRSVSSFQHVFERTLRRGRPASPFEGIGGVNPIVIGGGSTLSNVGLDFTQGDLANGGVTDIAMTQGGGMFGVTADGAQTFEYTRAGNFRFDANGNMVTQTGFQVMGIPGRINADGSFTATGTSQAISFGTRLDTTTLAWNDSQGVLHRFTRDANGNVAVNGAADAGLDTFQIAVASVRNPSGLRQTSSTNFVVTAASGPASALATPGGGVTAGRRNEQSNVQFISETIKSLEDQRSINAMLAMFRLTSDIISSFTTRLS